MTTGAIRLSPSGPPITNPGGGSFTPGPGARIRLTEAVSTMGGSQTIPTSPDLICPDGFGQVDAITLTLPTPDQNLEYRANIALDIVNTSTNVEGEVVLFLDVSVDGGLTYTNRAKNSHAIAAQDSNTVGTNGARSIQLWLPLSTGGALGINNATPAPSIKLRARAQSTVLSAGSSAVLVDSRATSAGSAPPAAVTGLNGTIHMELEECF